MILNLPRLSPCLPSRITPPPRLDSSAGDQRHQPPPEQHKRELAEAMAENIDLYV